MSYSNIKPLEQPDVYAALYDFVLAFALPVLPAQYIYRAWQNRVAMPNDEDFAVISLINSTRVGTNVKVSNINPLDDELVISTCTLIKSMIQLDFYSDSGLGQQRAQTIEMVARDDLAVSFLKPYGIAPLFADAPKEMAIPLGDNQYNQRYMIQFYINYWAKLDANVPWFDSATLNLIDVDVRYKP